MATGRHHYNGKDIAAQLLFDFCRLYGSPVLSLSQLMELEWVEMRDHYKSLGIACNIKMFSGKTIQWEDANDYPTLESQMSDAQNILSNS